MTLPQNVPYSKGVSAGLRLSMAALLVFYCLGYPVPVSIFWGALAGVAMGRIVYWLELKDEPAAEQVIEEDSLEDVARDRRQQSKVYARHYRQRRRSPMAFFRLGRLAFWKR